MSPVRARPERQLLGDRQGARDPDRPPERARVRRAERRGHQPRRCLRPASGVAVRDRPDPGPRDPLPHEVDARGADEDPQGRSARGAAADEPEAGPGPALRVARRHRRRDRPVLRPFPGPGAGAGGPGSGRSGEQQALRGASRGPRDGGGVPAADHPERASSRPGRDGGRRRPRFQQRPCRGGRTRPAPAAPDRGARAPPAAQDHRARRPGRRPDGPPHPGVRPDAPDPPLAARRRDRDRPRGGRGDPAALERPGPGASRDLHDAARPRARASGGRRPRRAAGDVPEPPLQRARRDAAGRVADVLDEGRGRSRGVRGCRTRASA